MAAIRALLSAEGTAGGTVKPNSGAASAIVLSRYHSSSACHAPALFARCAAEYRLRNSNRPCTRYCSSHAKERFAAWLCGADRPTVVSGGRAEAAAPGEWIWATNWV